jgi:outer membrane protease
MIFKLRSRIIILLAKKNFLIFFMMMICKSLFCISGFQLSFLSDIGIRSSVTNESVYENDNIISQLQWNVPAIPIISSFTEIGFMEIIVGIEYESAIPIKSGKMNDFDYLTGIPNVISHFSEHDVYVDKNYSIKTIIGYKLKIHENLQLIPFTGFSYRNTKYTAQSGYLQYPIENGEIWTGDEEQTKLAGIVISYEQALWFPLIGIKTIVNIYENFKFGLKVEYYPYINATTIDSHFLRMSQFYDKMYGRIGGKIELWGILYPFRRQQNIGIINSISYENCNCYGETSSSKIGITSVGFINSNNVNAGIKICGFLISLGICMIL